MEMTSRVLVVHDDLSQGNQIVGLLDTSKFAATCVRIGRECLETVRSPQTRPSLVILDSSMPGTEGLEILRGIRKICPDVPVAMMAGFMSGAFVLQASQAGAQAFLHKPVHPEELNQLATEFCHQPRAVPAGPESSVHLEELEHGNFFLATSPAMRLISEQVRTIARTDVPVLITGESGSGKEIIAQLLHKHSPRANRQLLKVNCAALPADLLESELFGYEAGAFTGAMKSKPGKFEICDKGTILLDEIGEMSPALQAKLLQVLQDGQFSRLGSRGNTKVDVRILAATNIDIEKSIANRSFREDLYYRLNAFMIRVPPLRERSQEIPYLLSELAARLAVANRLEPIGFSPRMIAAAVEYHWPGNLRELGNFLKRYLIMRDEAAAVVELESKTHSHGFFPPFPPTQHHPAPVDPGLKAVVRTMKDQTEIKMIRDVLDQANWNRRIAAEKLQISYKALLHKIRQYHLEVSA
jgi:two-component system, NtrC family, response regulator AtoC